MAVKVAVIYYSATGTVHALAQAVAEGAASAGHGGAAAAGRRAGARQRDRPEPAVAAARRRHHLDPRGRAGGPGVGRRVRVRHPDPVRRAGGAAQAVHRPGKWAVAGGEAGRQAGDGVHLGVQPARRQRGDDPVAGQRLLPLGLADRPARIQRPRRLRGGRQPLRHVAGDRADRRRPRRRGDRRGQVPGTAAGGDHDPAPRRQPRRAPGWRGGSRDQHQYRSSARPRRTRGPHLGDPVPGVRRSVHGDPGRVHRERGPALDPAGPRLHGNRVGLGGERLPAHLRRLHAAGWPCR